MTTFVVNLNERTDRLAHIKQQFCDKPRFDLRITDAVRDEMGSWGLWLTIQKIVSIASKENLDTLLLCEDDHMFTDDFNEANFFDLVNYLDGAGAEMLSGGTSWFDTVLPVKKNCFWVKNFHGLQFTVIYKRFFPVILNLDLKKGQNSDIELSSVSSNSFVCYPFISVQKEFGYSDVTKKNAVAGYVSGIFQSRANKLEQLYKIGFHYGVI